MNPILIAGMHRSGTSWVARTLSEAGVRFGQNLLGAELGNPYGHFEEVDIIALHDNALSEQGLTWQSTEPLERPLSGTLSMGIEDAVRSRLATSKPWAIKDPRLCLFLPEWLRVCPESRILLVYRRPDEVARSLHQRHAHRWVATGRIDPSDIAFWQSPDLAVKLWVHYNEALLRGIENIDHSRLHIIDWNDRERTSTFLDEIEAKWGLNLEKATTSYDPRLGATSDSPLEVRDSGLLERAQKVWAELHDLKHATASS